MGACRGGDLLYGTEGGSKRSELVSLSLSLGTQGVNVIWEYKGLNVGAELEGSFTDYCPCTP